MNELNALVVFGLATVYITYCLVWSYGPFEVFYRLRAVTLTRWPASWGRLLGCPWCVGFWAGLLCALLCALALNLALWWAVPLALAYAAAAGLLLEEDYYEDAE